MRNKRKLKKQNKIIVVSFICMTLLLSVGYAAFSTNIVLKGKGNLKGYTVTFDANGGFVDKKSKRVKYGSSYGDLPVPTREGYTFKGWNGKNLLNYNELLQFAISKDISIDSDGYISDSSPNSDNRTWEYNQSNWKFNLSSGAYILSLNFKNFTTNINNGIFIRKSDNTTIYGGAYSVFTNQSSYSITFTLQELTDLGILIKGYDGVYRIQLEKGDESTDWEPYFITSETEVVQEKDHTLTAIWEENPENTE